MSHRKMTKAAASIVFGATGTTGTYKITECNGFIKNLIIKVPDYTNTITTTVQILDDDGEVLYDSGAKAQNTDYPLGGIGAAELGAIPVSYNYTVSVVLSGVAGGTGGTVQVKMYIES